MDISIHAPVKGATSMAQRMTGVSSYFNPRSREGSDVHVQGPVRRCVLFQSTLP